MERVLNVGGIEHILVLKAPSGCCVDCRLQRDKDTQKGKVMVTWAKVSVVWVAEVVNAEIF